MDADVTSVTVLDRHTGTTGRAHVALNGHPSVPPSAFVKLAPFDAEAAQVREPQGMGVAEARFYRDLAHEVPVRVPKAWYAEFDGHRPRRRRPLRDGARRPRRVGLPLPRPRRRRHRGSHLRHRRAARAPARAVLEEPALRRTRRSRRGSRPAAPRRGDGGASFVQMAIDNLTDRLPDGFVDARGDVHRARAGDPAARTAKASARSCTAIRTSATSSSTATTRRAPASSTGRSSPTRPASATSRTCSPRPHPPSSGARTSRRCIARYREVLAEHGVTLDADLAWEQYRLFTIYGWCAATCTAAMGSNWQPEHIGLGGTERGTIAALDLDSVGLIADRDTARRWVVCEHRHARRSSQCRCTTRSWPPSTAPPTCSPTRRARSRCW